MGLLEKTKRRREKVTRASIPVGLANPTWHQWLQVWTRISDTLQLNVTSCPAVGDLPGLESLHAIVDTDDVPWDQQSRWLKQLEKALSARVHQAGPTNPDSATQTCYQYLASAVVPIICQAFLLATDAVPRKLCIAVLQSADKLAMGLYDRATLHGSSLKMPTVITPVSDNGLRHDLGQQILSN
ncbi:hypothetical protein H4R35_005399, partial [Dimargaris xerosporica]